MSEKIEAEMVLAVATKSYDDGYKDGLAAYAFWRNGRQYVNSTGQTLEDALLIRRHLWNYQAREVNHVPTKDA